MKHFIPCVLTVIMVSFGCAKVWSQSYEPGHVILNHGDTLYGKVQDRNDWELFRRIRFKGEKGKTKRYAAKDLQGYTMGIHTFESKWFAEESEFLRTSYYNRKGYGERVFLKVLHRGPLNVYAREFFYDDNSVANQYELFQRQGETAMQRATQGVFGLKKKRLASYFWDCPTLAEKIADGSLKGPLEVARYYALLCGDEQEE